MPSARKFGFELEYARGSQGTVRALYGAQMTGMDHAHDYHCRCEQCDYTGGRNRTPFPLRCQRDSTADGEFITKIIDNWDEARTIIDALTSAADTAGAAVGPRCGLHVHVDAHEGNDPQGMVDELLQRTVPINYLAFERYFTEIVAPGVSSRKRDMNTTLMQAIRQNVSDRYAPNAETWLDMGRGEVSSMALSAIARDRHVDLNWSRYGTFEFRVFNATNAPWRIELACRLAVAFVAATVPLRNAVESVVRGSKFWPDGCDSPWGEIIRPAFSNLTAPHPTKKPVVPMPDFIDILCDVDPALRPLIERQRAYMRARYAKTVEHAA